MFGFAVVGLNAQTATSDPAIDLSAPRPIFDIYNPLLGAGDRVLLGLGVQAGFHQIVLLGGLQFRVVNYISDDPFVGFAVGAGYRFREFSISALYHRNDYNSSLNFVRGVENGASLELGLDIVSLPIYIRNSFFAGYFHTRNSGNLPSIHDTLVAFISLYADYNNAIGLFLKTSFFHSLDLDVTAYGAGISFPMNFFDRRLVLTPFVGISGHAAGVPESFAEDIGRYYFSDFTLLPFRRLQPSDTAGNIAFVLNAEYRIFLLEALIDPVLENIFIGPFVDSGIFIDAGRISANLTGGMQLGVVWGAPFVLSVAAGYNVYEQWVFGVKFSSDI